VVTAPLLELLERLERLVLTSVALPSFIPSIREELGVSVALEAVLIH
jgi:hypothetical protein